VSRQLIVVKKPHHFPHRRGVNRKVLYERGKKFVKWVDDKGGWGEQIAAEIAVCQGCMAKHKAQAGSA
jgi:hypothetical protein